MAANAADDAKQAVKDVQDVSHKKDGGGADNAYAKLQEDINAEKVKLGGANTPEYKEYVKNVQTELQKAGLLPEMTLEWANQNKAALTFSSNDGGAITKDGIAKYQELAKSFNGGQDLDAVQQMFSTQLSNDFGSVAKSSDHNLGPIHWGDNVINGDDLNNALKAQTDLHGGSEQTMKLLTQARDSKGNLVPDAVFNMLDTAANGGSGDGKVSKDDVDAFLKNKNTDSSLKAMGYTDDQIKDLKTGLTDMSNNWDSEANKALRGGQDTLSQDSIAKAYGFDNLGQFATSENGDKPAAAAAAAAATGDKGTVKTDGDNTTVTYADGRERDFHFTGDKLDQVKDFNGTWKKDGDNWVDASDSSKKAPFKDVSVDRTTGAVTYDNGTDGKYTTNADGTSSLAKTDAAGNTITSSGDTYTVHEKDANKDVVVKVKAVSSGHGESSNEPYDVTLPGGGHYTKDDSGKWTGPDGKTDFHFDNTTGALSYTENSKVHSLDSSGKVTDGTGSSTIKLDDNKAQVTTNDAGAVTDIKYDGGKTRHFDYTDGKLTGFTNDDGHQYTSSDGGKTFTSTYVPKANEKADAPISNAKVDADGTLHLTVNEQNLKIGTDNKIVADGPTPPSKEIADQVNAKLIEDSKAKPGEGYIKIAARLLGKPDANDTDPAVYKLYKELQELNGNKPLYVGDAILTPEILAKVKDQDLKDYIQTLDDQATKATATGTV